MRVNHFVSNVYHILQTGQNLFHLHWHWALCLLELGDSQGALGIYDSYVC